MRIKVTLKRSADIIEVAQWNDSLIEYELGSRTQAIHDVVEILSQNNGTSQIIKCQVGAEFLVNTQDILNITMEG